MAQGFFGLRSVGPSVGDLGHFIMIESSGPMSPFGVLGALESTIQFAGWCMLERGGHSNRCSHPPVFFFNSWSLQHGGSSGILKVSCCSFCLGCCFW